MLNNSFLFDSYVRFLHQLLFLLKRLLFDGSFVVVQLQANIAAVVVSDVDAAVVPLSLLGHFPISTVFSPVSHFCLQTKSFDNGCTYTVQYTSDMLKL